MESKHGYFSQCAKRAQSNPVRSLVRLTSLEYLYLTQRVAWGRTFSRASMSLWRDVQYTVSQMDVAYAIPTRTMGKWAVMLEHKGYSRRLSLTNHDAFHDDWFHVASSCLAMGWGNAKVLGLWYLFQDQALHVIGAFGVDPPKLFYDVAVTTLLTALKKFRILISTWVFLSWMEAMSWAVSRSWVSTAVTTEAILVGVTHGE